MKIERLIGIIFYLINRECVTTNELAQKFEVSRRTILRDIDTLTLAGIPIYSELGVNGGYIINKDFKVDEKIIDNNNKEYILLALNSLRTVYGNKKVIETYEKMKHLYNDVNINTLPDVDFSVVTESPQIMGCVDLINKATKEQRTIKFTYTNSAGNTKKVFLNPLHTYYRWYSWYVFGYDTSKNDYRMFKVDVKMKKVYVYLLDDMAECEIGYILQAFSMEKLLKNGTKEFEVKTVSFNKEPVLTLGGLTIVPDYTISEVDFNASTALLLPGSSTWGSKENQEILEKAQECLNKNILVGAICGATLALADYGILDKFKHTSNSLEYLNFFSKNYAGQSSYVCSNSVLDRNLVTASSAGSLEWTKNILKSLNVYSDKKITAFYNYYSTGNVKYYDELLK